MRPEMPVLFNLLELWALLMLLLPKRPWREVSSRMSALADGRRDHLYGSSSIQAAQAGIGMLGADDNGQSRTVDVLIQQPDQSLLFFDHLDQGVQGAKGQAAIFAEQRRGPVYVQFALFRQIGERGRCQPHGARHAHLRRESRALQAPRDRGAAHD